jgi:hypothetical protein
MFCPSSITLGLTSSHTLTPAVLYILVPTLGLFGFMLLLRHIRFQDIPEPPLIPLFTLFVLFDGPLQVILTELFWKWSGMASIGLTFLVTAGPVLALVLFFRGRKVSHRSKYHRFIPLLSLAYLLAIAALIVIHST